MDAWDPAPSRGRRVTRRGRLLSLSAGTVLDASPEEALDAAAAAGFGGFGIRWDPERLPAVRLPSLRRQIDEVGLSLLDLEVVRLRPDVPVSAHRPWAETAAELGARFLLAVSHHESPARTAEELCELAAWCAPSGVTVALEFMRFTGVPTFRSASAVLRQAACPGLTVLVDALHLHRGGETAADLTAADAGPVGYVQVCDAPRESPGAPDDLGGPRRRGAPRPAVSRRGGTPTGRPPGRPPGGSALLRGGAVRCVVGRRRRATGPARAGDCSGAPGDHRGSARPTPREPVR